MKTALLSLFSVSCAMLAQTPEPKLLYMNPDSTSAGTLSSPQVPLENIRVTAQTLSKQTAAAMFGRLPKPITVASVQVCSESQNQLAIPQALIIQQMKSTNNYTLLPKDAAVSVVAQAQGRSPVQIGLRAAIGLDAGVQGLALAKLITPNTPIGAGLIMLGNVLQIATPIAAGTIPSHTFLTFATEMLPDPMVLAPLGCAAGYALVEAGSTSKSADFGMTIKTAKQTTSTTAVQ